MLRFADPFSEVDRLMGHFGAGRLTGGLMPMDAFEKDGVYTLRFDLPGVDPEKVDLTVENHMLTVTAERAAEDVEGVNWLLRERPTGIHSRQIRLSDRVDASGVSASYDDGVLTVTLPLHEEAKPHRIEVSSSKRDAMAAGV